MTPESEIEVRVKLNQTEFTHILALLESNKSFVTESCDFTDELYANCRRRNKELEVKTQLSRSLFDVAGLPVRVIHSIEVKQDEPEKELMGLRYISRKSFVHKSYIRFDLSQVLFVAVYFLVRGCLLFHFQVLEVDRARYQRQELAVFKYELELELVGSNPDYDARPERTDLYARSLYLKLIDCISAVRSTVSRDDLHAIPVGLQTK